MMDALFCLAVAVVVALAGIVLHRRSANDDAWDEMAKRSEEREAEEKAEDAVWARVKADQSREWPDHFTASEQAMAERAARRERLREEVARSLRKVKP